MNLQNDPANCGHCGMACPGGDVCSSAQCGLTCVGGSTKCGALCVDLENDPLHCGLCAKVCANNEVCAVGTCCTDVCAGACTNLDTDRNHCGTCSKVCAATEVCTDRACATAPTVTFENPADGATGVPINRPAVATFSVPMNPATIDSTTFTVKQGAISVAGVVTLVGATATFTPTANYPANVVLTATITTGAQDTSGNALAADVSWSFTTGTEIALLPVDLGAASPYAVLAFNTVTNVNNPGTIVTGDLGISPGAALTGFPPGQVIGTIHAGDPGAAAARVSLMAAFTDASGRLGAAALPGDLSGLTFAPGLYKNASTVALSSGNFTLDAKGDAAAVFIFQMGTTLTTNPGTKIILSGGAKAANVFWAVGSSATLGTTCAFKGTILAAVAITMNTGGSLEGRLLAKGAAVTLDTDVITVPAP